MKLFWRERKAEQEREAREAMTKMDEMVNGKPEPEAKYAWVTLNCVHCKIYMTQDPSKVSRFICSSCSTVINVSVEKHPKP